MVQPDAAFQAVGRPKLYASVVEQILASIRSGLFPPGSALPAERTLASRLQVSRGSLREALRVLEHAGVLDIRTGSGTYVATEDPGVFQQAQRFPEGAAADLQPARRRSFRRERAVPCGKSSDRMLARICSTTEAYNLGRPTAWNASSG